MIVLHNLTWSFIQIAFVFTYEFDIEYSKSVQLPCLYKAGPANYYFNLSKLWITIFTALRHGICAFLLIVFTMSSAVDSQGRIYDNWAVSLTIYLVLFYVSNVYLYAQTIHWNWINMYSSY